MNQTTQLTNIRTLPTADIELPPSLERLRDIAYDYWWSWSPIAQRLFGRIDPVAWRRYHNPVQLLINVEAQQWMRLLSDPEFERLYNETVASLDEYRAQPSWFEENASLRAPIAYFSMEFGIHESLGIYSGGLGVLAGDHCKAASDLGVPLVGVGLLYRSGYFRQTVDADGFQQHIYPDNDFSRLPVLPVQAPAGGMLTVPVDLPGRVVHAGVWKVQVGRVPVLMLDTDISLNDPADRPISGILYVRGREMRLCQEVVLGVGGVRALRALGIKPEVWHMNEGHVAFLGLERARERVIDGGDSLDSALAFVKAATVFTTHTPVPAGNETFDKALVSRYLEPWVRDVVCEPEEGLALGADNGNFNMTALAIRLSQRSNGVSKLHGRVSSDMWRHLFEGEDEEPVGYVTNGVHTQSWVGKEMRRFYTQHLGADWEQHLLDPDYWKKVQDAPDGALWSAHRSQKERLIRFVRERTRQQSARHGRSPDELRKVESLLDPHALTIGFARRFATYKRAFLVMTDIERLRAILGDPDRPVQFLFAGKAHPADREGQEVVRRIVSLTQGEFHGKLVFLEDYDIGVGRALVQGCDVWLNNPRKPQEASGTSGQKVPINGGINVSVLDGWWAEGYREDNGWAIGDGSVDPDTAAQDHRDAEALYHVLLNGVIPRFFDRDAKGLPREWIKTMKGAIESAVAPFSAHRMVRDYVIGSYLPVAESRER
jgi:starch phosphorylase